MDTALLKISIEHKVTYGEVARLADLIEHEGKIIYSEINEMPRSLLELIKAVHLTVEISQVRRGLIKAGEQTVVIPRKYFLNGG